MKKHLTEREEHFMENKNQSKRVLATKLIENPKMRKMKEMKL